MQTLDNRRCGSVRRCVAVLVGGLMAVTIAACTQTTTVGRSAPESSATSPTVARSEHGSVPVTVVDDPVPVTTDEEDASATSSPAAGSEPVVDDSVPASTSEAETPAEPIVGQTQPVTVVGAPLPTTQDFSDDPAIGMDAPTLEGFDFAEDEVVYDFSDGPTLLMFFAHWCPHCNRMIPVLEEWKASGQMPEELKVLAVSTSVKPTEEHFPPSAWFRDLGWTSPVMADSDSNTAAKAFGVSGFPYWVVVGADGKVKVRNAGEVSLDQIGPMIIGALNS